MTREEAIFCEKSYIGETNCTDCKYYGTETCQSRESHRMAIKALEQEPQTFKWCTDCKEYDQEKHCCHRYSKVIRDTVEEMKQEQGPKSEWEYDHAILKAYSDGTNEVLDKVRAEILCHIIEDDASGNTPAKLRNEWEVANKAHMIDIAIIDKYKAESEG